MLRLAPLAFVLLLAACDTPAAQTSAARQEPVEIPEGAEPAVIGSDVIRLDEIVLPEGFEISVYADNVPNARQIARSPEGTVFTGSRGAGAVYALRDLDGDEVADAVFTIAEGLNMPTGLAFHDGALYVAVVNRLLRYDGIDDRLADPPEPVVVYDDLPSDRHHGWKFIAFGPDDKLYVPVGAPCNMCEEPDPYASILRMNADGTGREVFARGIRNTVGFDFHPDTGELWFTDNGRDNMGADMAKAGLIDSSEATAYTDENPPCELNHAPRAGLHFGYPYVHGDDLMDPEYGRGKSAADYVAPVQELGPHTAPLGMELYEGDQFPSEYRAQALIAEHGSWNRTEKIGYRLTLVRLSDAGASESYEDFATGWLQGDEAWGRPVDLEHLPDGSLLVSDDLAGAIYRIAYTGE